MKALLKQHLVLGRVALSASDFVILTPDGDLYVADYGDGNPDVQAVRYCDSHDKRPVGVPNNVYRFRRPPTDAEMTQLTNEAKLLAEQ